MSTKANITISFLALCLFILLRPIFTISYFAANGLFGLKYLEIFSICISYLFIVLILLTLKQQRFDGASALLLVFCLYCGSSIAWGSVIREVARLILPALCFFIARANVKEENQLKALTLLSIIGYVVPVLGSAFLIILGKGFQTIYWTGLNRYFGMYEHVHALAHSMFVFIFFILLYLYFSEKLNSRRRLSAFSIYSLGLIALFNLGKTYTRTVLMGFFVLSFFYLIGRRNYKILAAIILGTICVVLSSSTFEMMIYDFIYFFEGKRDLSWVGSGRMGLWNDVLINFINLSFANQILGAGVSTGGIMSSHNDLLSLMFTLGAIGLFLYISFMSKVFFDIATAIIDRKLKYTFLGFILAVFAMNFASNSYLSRVELAQYFYFIIGTFYGVLDAQTHHESSHQVPKRVVSGSVERSEDWLFI